MDNKHPHHASGQNPKQASNRDKRKTRRGPLTGSGLAAGPPPLAPGQAVRMAAATALAGILAHAKTVDECMASDAAGSRFAPFDPRDRALMRSIIVVSLRHLGTIRQALARFIEKPLPRKAQALDTILITAAAQILFLGVPDHSAVDLAVRAAKHDSATAPFAKLANAVLRNVIRNREDFTGDNAATDPFIDTPQWLAVRWANNWGEQAARAIAAINRSEPALDLTVRDDPQGWAQKLDGIVLPTGAATGSIRLNVHTPIDQLAGYEDGSWWVQDASAALPARLLGPQAGERIADLCAAPGGKTAQMALAGAHVVAVDRSAGRLKRLHENLRRLDLEADVRASDALVFRAEPFDAILLDAPCTATGTIRRHPEVAWNKRQSDLASLTSLQSKLLDHAADLLRPGGRLVYCTCSIEPEEGEYQIASLLRRNPDISRQPVSAAETGGLEDAINKDGDLRILPYFLPHINARLSGMDGFFISRLTRLR